MGLILNGNSPSKILYNGAEVSLYFNGSKIWPDGSPTPPGPDPYNPLNLPANTVRVRTSDGNVPIKVTGMLATTYETATLVAGTTDVYDVYKSGTNFARFLYRSTNVVEILGANTTGITDMGSMFFRCTSLTSVPLFDTSSVTSMIIMFCECTSLTTVSLFDTSSVTSMKNMFKGCTSLTSVPLFDTSSVTDMESMFNGCSSLTSVPLFDTSSVTSMITMFSVCSSLTYIPLFNTSKVSNMGSMFTHCYNVQSGALALYQQASTQATPPSAHSNAFYNCGRDTITGAAELAQIPTSWGGTMS